MRDYFSKNKGLYVSQNVMVNLGGVVVLYCIEKTQFSNLQYIFFKHNYHVQFNDSRSTVNVFFVTSKSMTWHIILPSFFVETQN